MPSVTGKVYNHSKRMKEKRAVLDGVAAELRRIIGQPAVKTIGAGSSAARGLIKAPNGGAGQCQIAVGRAGLEGHTLPHLPDLFRRLNLRTGSLGPNERQLVQTKRPSHDTACCVSNLL